ncbi:MAG: hypothetical protein M1827_000862 [Pycnora praestabilis]|nr:MAG: hypothetical protein M1827_000862 [Pycnora praestabilis]
MQCWIEEEKTRIIRSKKRQDISALNDALAWAARHPDPDPDPDAFTDRYKWGEKKQNDVIQAESLQENEEEFPAEMMSTAAPYYATARPTVFDDNASPHGQSYGDHSAIYNDMARSLAPDAASYAFAHHEFKHGGDGIIQTGKETVPLSAGSGKQSGYRALYPSDHNIAIVDGPIANQETPQNGSVATQINGDGETGGNDQFAGLLEAVTTAAGQEAAEHHSVHGSVQDGSNQGKRVTRQSQAVGQPSEKLNTARAMTGKRKRAPSLMQAQCNGDTEGVSMEAHDAAPPSMRTRKRRRVKEPTNETDAEEVLDDGQDVTENVDNEDQSTLEIRELPPQLAMSDARAAGVHSAAALFRRPSASSKKYTRPPMSKLFTSLELSPENFLHLQAGAKSYMLDLSHPERQNCVGNRGKGDTDMVKLRLYSCVKDFLETEGCGEKYFGKDVVNEGMGQRKFTWPEQKNRIIGLVTPLLRRMVTNERQRQYAIESRKGGVSTTNDKKRKIEEIGSPSHHMTNAELEQESYTQHDSLTGPRENGTSVQADYASGDLDDPSTTIQIFGLGTLSGLNPEDWQRIVAAVQDHIRGHLNGRSECEGQRDACQKSVLEIEISEGILDKSNWGTAPGDTDDDKYTALLILRDLFELISTPHPLGESQRPVVVEAREKNTKDHPTPNVPRPSKKQKLSTTLTSRPIASMRSSRSQGPQESASQLLHGSVALPPTPTDSAIVEGRWSSSAQLTLHINIVKEDKRVVPRFDLPADDCPDIETLKHKIAEYDPTELAAGAQLQIHSISGMQAISDTNALRSAITLAKQKDWLDGILTVVVDLGP